MVIEGLSETLRENNSVQSHFTRTYQMDLGTRRFFIGQGLAIFLLLLIVTPLHLFGYFRHSMSAPDIVAIDALAGVYAPWCWAVFNRRVVLYEDSIAVVGWLSMRKLALQEIRGRSTGTPPAQVGGGSYHIIVPLDQNARDLALPPFLHVDEFCLSWMKGIPKVDARHPRSRASHNHRGLVELPSCFRAR
jgi:hypothetical protein